MILTIGGDRYPVFTSELVWPAQGNWILKLQSDTNVKIPLGTSIELNVFDIVTFRGFVFTSELSPGSGMMLTVLPGSGLQILKSKQFNASQRTVVETCVKEAGEQLHAQSVFESSLARWYRVAGTLPESLGRLGNWHTSADGKYVFGSTWPDAESSYAADVDQDVIVQDAKCGMKYALVRDGFVLTPSAKVASVYFYAHRELVKWAYRD